MKKLSIILFLLVSFTIFSQTVTHNITLSPLPVSWTKSENKGIERLDLNYKVVLFNKSETPEDYILRIYDKDGVKIGYKTGTLNPYTKEEVEVDNCLTEENATPSSVKLIANNILMLIIANDSSGERLTSYWPPDVGAKQTM